MGNAIFNLICDYFFSSRSTKWYPTSSKNIWIFCKKVTIGQTLTSKMDFCFAFPTLVYKYNLFCVLVKQYYYLQVGFHLLVLRTHQLSHTEHPESEKLFWQIQWVRPMGNTGAFGQKCCPLPSLLPIDINWLKSAANWSHCCPLVSPTVHVIHQSSNKFKRCVISKIILTCPVELWRQKP